MTEQIAVDLDETFEIALDAVPTAGFAWTLIADPPDITELLGSEWRLQGRDAGGQSEQVFRLRAIAQGEQTLRFRYGRSWEATIAEERIFVVRVAQGDPEGEEVRV
jgi:predicted secreted protein